MPPRARSPVRLRVKLRRGIPYMAGVVEHGRLGRFSCENNVFHVPWTPFLETTIVAYRNIIPRTQLLAMQYLPVTLCIDAVRWLFVRLFGGRLVNDFVCQMRCNCIRCKLCCPTNLLYDNRRVLAGEGCGHCSPFPWTLDASTARQQRDRDCRPRYIIRSLTDSWHENEQSSALVRLASEHHLFFYNAMSQPFPGSSGSGSRYVEPLFLR